MIDQIEQILTRHLSTSPALFVMGKGGGMRDAKINGIPDAAYAIAALFERQPVDRVRAMAALVTPCTDGGRRAYDVDGHRVIVEKARAMRCYDMATGQKCNDNCDHIKAVEMFKSQNATN